MVKRGKERKEKIPRARRKQACVQEDWETDEGEELVQVCYSTDANLSRMPSSF